jgi:hypothetical protein
VVVDARRTADEIETAIWSALEPRWRQAGLSVAR